MPFSCPQSAQLARQRQSSHRTGRRFARILNIYNEMVRAFDKDRFDLRLLERRGIPDAGQPGGHHRSDRTPRMKPFADQLSSRICPPSTGSMPVGMIAKPPLPSSIEGLAHLASALPGARSVPEQNLGSSRSIGRPVGSNRADADTLSGRDRPLRFSTRLPGLGSKALFAMRIEPYHTSHFPAWIYRDLRDLRPSVFELAPTPQVLPRISRD